MSSRMFVTPDTLDWKKAYLAAVLESDRTQIPDLVQQAKEKLSQRLHELSAFGAIPYEEIEAIHDALYLLDALMSSLSYRQDAAQWTAWDQDN